jgi:hypothetical protein
MLATYFTSGGLKMAMFKKMLVLLFAFVASHAMAALPYEELLYKGRAYGEYELYPKTPRATQLIRSIKQTGFAENLAGFVSNSFRLKRDLAIRFETCGNPGAFFTPSRNTISLCLELFELINTMAQTDGHYAARLSPVERQKVVTGTIIGILYHELAHALIAINQIPVTGREEDVADQFAFYYGFNYFETRGQPVTVPTMWFFNGLARMSGVAGADQAALRRLLADEHSLSEQRVYNFACWAYGSQTPQGFYAANFAGLDQQRAVRCAKEFQGLNQGIQTQFQKYIKTVK